MSKPSWRSSPEWEEARLWQQRAFLKKAPGIFAPCNGAWGRQGATSVHLPSARVALVRAALHSARKNVTLKGNKAQRAKWR